MYILGFDTTQAACSAAIYDTDNQRICGRVWQPLPRGHAETLPQIITLTLKQASLSFSDIGKLAVTTGPGSFTGVRIGVSAARGFALALNLPLVGITSLEVIAANVADFEQKTIMAAFDARRDEVYVQMFDQGAATSDPQVLSVDDAAELTANRQMVHLVGTAGELLIGQNANLTDSQAPDLPDAAVIAKIAAERAPQSSVQPLYLRRADAKSQKPLLNIEPGRLSLINATPAHCKVLAQIHGQGFASPWSGKEIESCLASPGTRALIATNSNNEPLGFVIYRDGGGECEILTLAVGLQARRRSVATTLLRAILDQTDPRDRKKIFLEVSENNFPAQSLYKKLSFLNCGVRKKYYTENDGQKYDAVIMQRAL